MSKQMTSRERVMMAVSLEEPDRVPLDIGGHRNGTIHAVAYQRLKEYLGIDAKTDLVNRMMQASLLDERVLQFLETDTRGAYPGSRDKSKDHDLPDGTWVDDWGVERHKPEGNNYYDLKRSPLAGNISIGDVVNYEWPDPEDPGIVRGLRDRVLQMRNNGDYAIVMNLPSPIVHISQYLRGFTDWYIDLIDAPGLIGALMDAVLEINLEIIRNILLETGDIIDIVMTADDLGTQNALQFSPEIFRELFKQRLGRFFEVVHKGTEAKLLFHSCGSIYPIIGDLIDIGIDVLNPVQPKALDMDPGKIKREFGDKIAFWGAIDTQEVMPRGSTQDVRKELETRFNQLGEGGGWVLSPAHNLQPEVPVENIVELSKSAREICRYG